MTIFQPLQIGFPGVAAIVRPFGVRLPFLAFRKSKGTLQSLTFSQLMLLIGIIYWGCDGVTAT